MHLFGKKLLIRLSLLYSLFLILAVSRFGLEGGTVVLIAPVPEHCLPFTCLLREQ